MMNNIENKELWSKILVAIKKNIGVGAFNTWVSKLTFVSIDGNTLRLSVNSNFIKDAIVTKYHDEILQTAQTYDSKISAIEITVCVNDLTACDLAVPGSLFSQSWKTEVSKSKKSSVTSKDLNNSSTLDKKFTFDNFIVGQSNEVAYVVAKNIATSSSLGFNPLFLYGGVGMGKTHLVQAIAWYKRNNQPDTKVVYVSAERFMYLFLKALRLKDTFNFKDLFSDIDVLIVDDVQFISGKSSTQEEFLYTFNKFIDSKRQIVLAANKAPSELPGMDNTLKSRLNSGLVVDVHPSTYELRLEILQHGAKRLKASIPHIVIEKLAENITSSIRELEGALNRLVVHATLVNRQISIEMANDVLNDVMITKHRVITLQSIQDCVCHAFAITLDDMLSTTRVRTVAIARQIAMYLSKELTEHSYSEIGKIFGERDHSTVVHAVKNIKNKMFTDRSFNNNIEKLRKSL